MDKIVCPSCRSVFSISESESESILSQLKTEAFQAEVREKVSEALLREKGKHELELQAKSYESQSVAERLVKEEKDRATVMLRKREEEIASLRQQVSQAKEQQELAVLKSVRKAEEENHRLTLSMATQKEAYEFRLKEKDEQISLYKDLKSRMSTKMVGESLEQHCANLFATIRGALPKTVSFEKDNAVSKSGSKGDFVYREWDGEGNEVVSIMFEMKNEQEHTATKHKNEDFFKELDKDRREKSCEYAVLVSLLEAESEIYNAGIVDVSYRYDKMYVIRPQCFIPIITILRNAAMSAMDCKRELALARTSNLDVAMFEDKLCEFKDSFGRNYRLAHSHFEKAIEEIDKTIDHLKKVRDELVGSERQLRIANDKVEDVSIKKLTRDNPTMREKFNQSGQII